MSYVPAYKQDVNGVQLSATPPPCSIMAFLGTIDPDGWVICDGVQRSNSDGRYNNLIAQSIGSVNSSMYTPPNYKGAFLRGTGEGSGEYSIYSGNNINIPQHMKIIDHAHGSAAHSHTVPAHNHFSVASAYGARYALQSDGNDTIGGDRDFTANEVNLVNGKTNLNYTLTSTEGPFTASGTSVTTNSTSSVYIGSEICPYNYGVNWIIKL